MIHAAERRNAKIQTFWGSSLEMPAWLVSVASSQGMVPFCIWGGSSGSRQAPQKSFVVLVKHSSLQDWSLSVEASTKATALGSCAWLGLLHLCTGRSAHLQLG